MAFIYTLSTRFWVCGRVKKGGGTKTLICISWVTQLLGFSSLWVLLPDISLLSFVVIFTATNLNQVQYKNIYNSFIIHDVDVVICL